MRETMTCQCGKQMRLMQLRQGKMFKFKLFSCTNCDLNCTVKTKFEERKDLEYDECKYCGATVRLKNGKLVAHSEEYASVRFKFEKGKRIKIEKNNCKGSGQVAE